MRKNKVLATIFIFLAVATVAGVTLLSQRQVNGEEKRRIRINPKVSSMVNLLDGSGWLGVQLEDVTAENKSQYKLNEEMGVIVKEVEKDSPAERAGLREKDVIISYAGQPVFSAKQFARLVRETPTGRTVVLGILRDGAQQTLQVKIEERSGDGMFPRHVEVFPEGKEFKFPGGGWSWEFSDRPRLGVNIEDLTGQMAEFFGVKGGVLITAVREGSPAAKAGLKAGDVITAVDNKSIDGSRDLSSALRKKSDGEQVTLSIVRDKRPMTITLQLEESKKSRGTTRGLKL